MMQGKSINIFLLTMINLATILSVRNWPVSAQYGLASVGFLILAMVCFFIPAALVSAELATGWPQKGGVFVWVKEALGHRLGFLAVWLLWIENVVWYPIILAFIAASFAYAINPLLANNHWYMFFMIIGIFWLVTYVNFGGMKLSGWISTTSVILGTLLPGILIIILGMIWMGKGYKSQIQFSWGGILPKLNSFSELAFLAGILLSFCGIEMSAVHAKDVEHPKKNYPRAIFLSASVIVVLTILGTLAIAAIIPQKDISLVSGSIETIYHVFEAFKLTYFIPVIAVLIAIGALGGVSTWVAGPCRGLLAAAEKGDFPPIMRTVNEHSMPVNLMIMQGVIVSILASVFIFLPNVSSSFWMLTVLSSQLYLIMYILMFIAAIILRYTRKDVERTFSVPGGNVGMWIVSGIGCVSAFFAILLGFLPPPGVVYKSTLGFVLFLIIGILLACGIPFLLFAFRKRWSHST